MCSPPQVSLLPSAFIPLCPLVPPTPFPSDNHRTVVCVYEDFFCLIPSHFPPSPPIPSPLTAVFKTAKI